MRAMFKLSVVLATLMSLLVIIPSFALADSSSKSAIQCGVNSAASGDCNNQPSGNLDTTIHNIVNVLSVIIGVAAVIMIIIGGLKYITSAGNAENAKSARQTIIYAVIGLIIVVLAQTLARFVLTETTSTSKAAGSSSSSSGCSDGRPVC